MKNSWKSLWSSFFWRSMERFFSRVFSKWSWIIVFRAWKAATDLHMEIHKHGLVQQTLGGGPSASSNEKRGRGSRGVGRDGGSAVWSWWSGVWFSVVVDQAGRDRRAVENDVVRDF
nr:hypothetical protein CFP56_34511 [Quercus suber]